MTSEQFSNLAQTTLNASINAGATSLVVVSAANFPTSGQFRIVIDSEVFLVTAVSGTTFTVTPGFEGSTQSAHSSGASVAHVLTAGIISNLYPAQSPATFVVAASNSVNKARANYVCTGTNDDIIINAALAALPTFGQAGCRSGKVLLLSGDYSLGNPIVIDGDLTTLEGENFPMWGGYNHSWTSTSSPASAIGSGAVAIKAASTGFDLVSLQNSNIPAGIGSNSGDQNRHRGICIRNLYLVGNAYSAQGISTAYGASPLAGGSDWSLIENCMIHRCSNGINVAMDSVTIRNNSIQDCSGAGITLSGTNGKILENLIYDIGGIGIVTYTNAIISGNELGDTSSYAIQLNAGDCICTGNRVINASNSPIGCNSSGNVISNNQLGCGGTGSVWGIFLNNGNNHVVSGNIITGPNSVMTGEGIGVGGGTGNVITGNSIAGIWNYGLGNITGSNLSANYISNNTAFIPAAGPAAITSATVQAWYKAASVTGVSSGSAITTWPDSSGFGRNLSINSGSPLFESSGAINSGNTVRFNGTNDSLVNTSLLLPGQPVTMFAVVNMSATAISKGRNCSIMNCNQGAGGTNAFTIDSGTNEVACYAGFYAVSGSTVLSTSTSYVLEMVVSGSSSLAGVNGTITSTFNPGTQNWTKGLFVSANASGSTEYFPGDMAELVIYSGAMSASDRSTVRQALGTKYGITVLP